MLKKVKMTKCTTNIDLLEVQKVNQKIGIEEENPNQGLGHDNDRDRRLKAQDI